MIRGSAGLLLIGLLGCQPDQGSPFDAVEASGPCWEVNLADGLDESSSAELHALYACLNRTGALEPLDEVDVALEAPGREGTSAALEVSQLLNTLLETRLQPANLVDGLRDWLEADPQVEPWVEIAVELVYARPYDALAAETAEALAMPAALQAGVVHPLLGLAPTVAGSLLDHDPTLPATLFALGDTQSARDLTCTLAGVVESEDSTVVALEARLLPDLGALLQATTHTDNDLWSGSTGSSLRDVATAVLASKGGQPSFVRGQAEPLHALLADAALVEPLESALAQSVREGTLDDLFSGLAYLSRVDAEGGGLHTDEDSALTVLLRLLAAADKEIDCGFLSGNLAVLLLDAIADLDPSLIQTGLGLLGDVLGVEAIELLLDLINEGICDGAITDGILVDLGAMNRLSDAEAGDLLDVLVPLVGAVRAGGGSESGRLPEVVGLLRAAHEANLGPPLGGLLLDIEGTAFLDDVVDAMPLILEPDVLAVDACPIDSDPLDLPAALHLLDATLAAPDAPIHDLAPLLDATLSADEGWTALDHAALLLIAPSARLQDALPLFVNLLSARDPSAETGLVEDLLSDPALVLPALRLIENRPLVDALRDTAADEPGPMPWIVGLARDGLLTSLLTTVDLILEALDSAAPSSDAETP
jgi:hypothetical protein